MVRVNIVNITSEGQKVVKRLEVGLVGINNTEVVPNTLQKGPYKEKGR